MDERQQLLDLGQMLVRENYPQFELHHIDIIQSGGIKTIWKLETSIGTLCLKRIRKSLPIVTFTTAAQAYLSRKGAKVANIVPAKDHGLYIVYEGYALVLYMWIEGNQLEMKSDSEHLCVALQGLAQFHLDSAGFIPPKDCKTYDRMGVWPDHYAEMLEELKLWKKLSDQETSTFHQAFSSTADDMIRMGVQALHLLQSSCYTEWVQTIGQWGYMCHQDYGKGNALLTEEGVYILDLDNLAYDIPLRDVRKLLTKRMENQEAWNLEQLSRYFNCYASIFPLTLEQMQILYIDLLFPHTYYGEAKNPFKKGKSGEAEKIMESHSFESGKISVLQSMLPK